MQQGHIAAPRCIAFCPALISGRCTDSPDFSSS